jgi:phytoene dehydrogenase-like protein
VRRAAAPRWPSRPLFYVCVPSVSDDSVAPAGDENLFVLVPLAAGLTDSDEMREACCAAVLERLERHTVRRPRIRRPGRNRCGMPRVPLFLDRHCWCAVCPACLYL